MKIQLDVLICKIENAFMKKNLNDWLIQNGITRKQFAKLINKNPGIVSRILNEQGLPSLELAVEIEKVTGGWMKCADWIEADLSSGPAAAMVGS